MCYWPSSAPAADAALEGALLSDRYEVWTGHDSFALRRAVNWGMHRIEVLRPASILIKTSTAGMRSNNHEVSAFLLEAVVQALRTTLPESTIYLADGPAFGTSFQSEARNNGWQSLIDQYGLLVRDLNQDFAPDQSVPDWPISSLFRQVDFIVNLSKAKTHRRFGVSLASKSLLGLIVGKHTGYPKLAGRHRQVPKLTSYLESISPPSLSLIDGVRGIEGEGPLNGTPTRSSFIVAAEGYFAADIAAVVEMGFDPALVPGLLRPHGQHYEPKEVDWLRIRKSALDFAPSASCSWLYHSLVHREKRDRVFSALLIGARQCWDGVK